MCCSVLEVSKKAENLNYCFRHSKRFDECKSTIFCYHAGSTIWLNIFVSMYLSLMHNSLFHITAPHLVSFTPRNLRFHEFVFFYIFSSPTVFQGQAVVYYGLKKNPLTDLLSVILN